MEQVIKQDSLSRKLEWFWFGLMIYNVGYCGNDIEIPFVYRLGVMFGVPACLYALFCALTERSKESIASRAVFFPLIAWLCFMYFNSKPEMMLDFYSYFYTFTILPYLGFFFLIIPTLSLLRSFFAVAYRTYWWYFFVCLIPLCFPWKFGFIQIIFESYAIAAVFIFLTNKYHPSKMIILSAVALFISFLVVTLTARRNVMLTIALYIMIGSLSYLFGSKIKSLENRIVLIVCTVLFMILAIFVFVTDSSGAFALISQRASENTREGVFLAFALDMDQLSDWIWGRGIFGTYYCPGVDGEGTEDRGAIECGYLQWILNGGIVYLVLYLAVFITAVVKGLRAHNQLCHACGWIALVQIIDMFPFGLHAFDNKTFMIWMAVAVCYNKSLCSKSDDEISALCFEEKAPILPWQK
jgi:hypothetical protein